VFGKLLSRDRLVALGELKNLAGLIMDAPATPYNTALVSALVLRMEAIVDGSSAPCKATPSDIEEVIASARVVRGIGRAARAN
jgi:hypothetical protein